MFTLNTGFKAHYILQKCCYCVFALLFYFFSDKRFAYREFVRQNDNEATRPKKTHPSYTYHRLGYDKGELQFEYMMYGIWPIGKINTQIAVVRIDRPYPIITRYGFPSSYKDIMIKACWLMLINNYDTHLIGRYTKYGIYLAIENCAAIFFIAIFTN